MKKIKYVLLFLLVLVCFSACNNPEANKSDNTSLPTLGINITTTIAAETTEINSIYENVIFEIMNKKVNVPLDESLNKQLEQAKTVKEPTLDTSMKETGIIWVQYKDKDELIEFGKVYTGDENKMYIQAFENEYNGVLCISEENENNSNILF